MEREGSSGQLRRISSAERRVLLWVLRTTGTGPIDFETIKEWSRVSGEIVKNVFKKFNLRNGQNLTTDDLLRISMTLFGTSVSPEELSISLNWELFEELAARLFEHAGLNVARDVQVRFGRNRAQIDLFAFKEDALYIVECKRWRRSITLGLIKSIEPSIKRRILLVKELLSGLVGPGSFEVRLIPLLLTVYGSPYFDDVLFHSPLRSLRSFLSEPAASLPSPPVLTIYLRQPLVFQVLKALPLKPSKGWMTMRV